MTKFPALSTPKHSYIEPIPGRFRETMGAAPLYPRPIENRVCRANPLSVTAYGYYSVVLVLKDYFSLIIFLASFMSICAFRPFF